MKSVVVLQARTNSARLPGKALRPVAGYPSAVLAALRVGNTGLPVIAATSDDPSDDALAAAFREHGVRVFRGPTDDVLSRFYLATADLPEDCAVVRVTGDNLVHDGSFMQEMLAVFEKEKPEYLGGDPLRGRLPYGVGGEVFTVAVLRRAHANATSAHDREHVCPWMRRHCRSSEFAPASLEEKDYTHLRCTMDDDEDYQRILRLFEGIRDPVHAGWQELVEKLATLPGEPAFHVPRKYAQERFHSELTLGTAQLGMAYGIVNRSGKPAREDAIALVRRAIAHGVNALDTARSYGEAEQALGEALAGAWASRAAVVTKLDALPGLAPDADAAAVRAAVDESVNASCRALGVSRLEVLLLHRWQHHDAWAGAAWEHLLELRERGRIGALGASVYEPREALAALADKAVRHLQIPMNVLDRRWKAAGVDRAIAERADVVVHARSIFLQGILVHPAERWPEISNYDAFSAARKLTALARRFGRESVADLCVAYVRSQSWITSLVLGCETMAQLDENLRLFLLPRLSHEQCGELEQTLRDSPEALLNPARWNSINEPKLQPR